MPITPPDSRTLLLGLQPQARTPYDAPDVVAERRAHVEQLREQQKQKQEAEYDNQVYDWAIKNNLGPDGTPDIPAVQKALYSVNARVGDKFAKAVQTAKKSQADLWKLTDEHNEADDKTLAQWAQGITPENYGDRLNFLQTRRPDLLKRAGLPTTYDPMVVPTRVTTLTDAATTTAEQNKKNDTVRSLALDGKYDQALAHWIDSQGPNFKDDKATADGLEAQFHQLQQMGAPATTIQGWRNRGIDNLRDTFTPNTLTTPVQRATLAQTKAHDKAMEDQAAATLANTQTNQAQIEAREQQRIRLEADGQQNTEKYRANELALQRLRLGQDATDKATSAGYNVSKNRLDTLRKPLADTQTRMSRLIDTVNQATPEADALIAPELMTVMAGGMASGLRINEAEISRVVGGRSNVESLKAALNKWQLDPSKALSVTPAQRQQIRALIQVVGQKADAKMKAIQQADDDLLDAPNVDAQRRIIVKAQKDVEDISGTAGGATDKVMSQATLQLLATKHGVTIDQERQNATANGWTIK